MCQYTSQYAYINHSANMHHNVPLWVATNALTFGQISKMYQYATTDLRTKISKNFTNISEKQLHQFVTIIARCRNVCAHGERLFSFRIHETIPDKLIHRGSRNDCPFYRLLFLLCRFFLYRFLFLCPFLPCRFYMISLLF